MPNGLPLFKWTNRRVIFEAASTSSSSGLNCPQYDTLWRTQLVDGRFYLVKRNNSSMSCLVERSMSRFHNWKFMNSNSWVTDTKYLVEKIKNLCANKRPFSIELSNLKSSSESWGSFFYPKNNTCFACTAQPYKNFVSSLQSTDDCSIIIAINGLLYRWKSVKYWHRWSVWMQIKLTNEDRWRTLKAQWKSGFNL